MKHVIRTSDRGTFRSCRQEWDWSSKIRDNLEPRARYTPFEDGTTWHNAMEVYYDPETWEHIGTIRADVVHVRAMQALLATHDAQIKTATELYDEDILPEERLEEYAERLEMLKGMLRHYFVWAPTVDAFKPVKVEVEFEVPVLDPQGRHLYIANFDENLEADTVPVFYQGRLDGIVEDQYGRYWILEHKTAGQFGDTAWLELDAQCGSYAWAMRELGIKAAGIIYSQAYKGAPTPPPRLQSVRQGRRYSVNKTQRTTYQLYKKTLEEAGEPLNNYEEFLNYLQGKPNPFFRRIEVYRNDASLDYVGNTIYLEAATMLNDPPIYPSPGPFSCNWCRFREPCIAKQNGLDYQFMLDELFVERK